MKLKPCPSCGGEDIRCEDKDTKSFYCYECDLQSRKCETIEEAIEAWNRREPMDRIVYRLEKQKELREKELLHMQYKSGFREAMNKAIEIVKGGA